jgi:hypothetical protein
MPVAVSDRHQVTSGSVRPLTLYREVKVNTACELKGNGQKDHTFLNSILAQPFALP